MAVPPSFESILSKHFLQAIKICYIINYRKKKLGGPIVFSVKKAFILNALIERQGLQHIVNAAAAVFGNPVFLYDMSWKILARSSANDTDEQTWNDLFPDGHLIFQDFMQVEKAGIYSRLLHEDAPVFGKFDFYPRRFLGCRVRDKSNVVGFVTIVENKELNEEDKEFLIVLIMPETPWRCPWQIPTASSMGTAY